MSVILGTVDLLNQDFRLFQWFYSHLTRQLTQFKQFSFHREKYSKYNDHFCYEVVVWAEKHGQKQAGKKYAISESTVTDFLKSYHAQKSLAVKNKALKQGKRGKRTMLQADIDENVLEMICNIHNAGVVINFYSIVAELDPPPLLKGGRTFQKLSQLGGGVGGTKFFPRKGDKPEKEGLI